MDIRETQDREALFDVLYKAKQLIREAEPMKTLLGQAYLTRLDKMVNDVADELFDDRRPRIIKESSLPPRFSNTYCSQCGADFGPGPGNGFSHCSEHDTPIFDWMTRK